MSNGYQKIEGEPGYLRDQASGGVIATDEAYSQYKSEKTKRLKEAALESRINRLEQGMGELRSGMQQILSLLRGNNGNSTS